MSTDNPIFWLRKEYFWKITHKNATLALFWISCGFWSMGKILNPSTKPAQAKNIHVTHFLSTLLIFLVELTTFTQEIFWKTFIQIKLKKLIYHPSETQSRPHHFFPLQIIIISSFLFNHQFTNFFSFPFIIIIISFLSNHFFLKTPYHAETEKTPFFLCVCLWGWVKPAQNFVMEP